MRLGKKRGFLRVFLIDIGRNNPYNSRSMSQKHVLIVDDSIEMLEVLRRHLSAMNYQTFQATNVSDAVEILKSSAVDLLITDLQL